MMASVLVYHAVGDLIVGKPELVEFHDTETLDSAIQVIADSPECSIPIWKKRSSSSHANTIENIETRQQRFVGILNSFDIAAFLANNQPSETGTKLKTPVSDVVVPDNSLLRIVDPATRLIDALDMMKQGVKRVLVPKSKSLVWKSMSKRFSVEHYAKLLKNIETSTTTNKNNPDSSSLSSASIPDKFCCLSREDVLRFIIGCLGALAPLPLTSIAALGAINPMYNSIESSTPAIEVTQKLPHDPSAVAVVESTQYGQHKIIGEISACKLWKCDYSAAARALANLSAGQFVMGVEDHHTSSSRWSPQNDDLFVNSTGGDRDLVNGVSPRRPRRKFSSRSMGFFSSNHHGNSSFGPNRNMYMCRSGHLTCKVTSSLAAVMAQMLSHRATHVWVTEDDSDDVLVGVVGYADILAAVTKPPTVFNNSSRSVEGLGSEIQSFVTLV